MAQAASRLARVEATGPKVVATVRMPTAASARRSLRSLARLRLSSQNSRKANTVRAAGRSGATAAQPASPPQPTMSPDRNVLAQVTRRSAQ